MRGACLAAILLLLLGGSPNAVKPGDADSAELDRQRLVGGAHYENDDFGAAAEAFRRCVALAPDSADDHFNLALTLMRGAEYEEALHILSLVEKLDPDLLGVHYIRGIIYKNQGSLPEAIASLQHVVEKDPQCFGAYYNLGVCYKKTADHGKARESFETAIQVDPRHPSPHYQVITLARVMGDVEGAARHAEIFGLLNDTIDESEKTAEALERSRYTYLITAPRLGRDLEPALEDEVRFIDVTEEAGLLDAGRAPAPPPLPSRMRRTDYVEADLRAAWVTSLGGAVALADVDRDDDLDIFVANSGPTPALSADRLYLNSGSGRFRDATASFGLAGDGRATDAIFGDYDNDGHDDLYVVNDGPNALYRNRGDGRYRGSGAREGDARAVSILELRDPLPAAYTISLNFESMDIAGQDYNAFVIFDYRGPEDFKFAGARVTEGYWTVGRFDGSWVDEARLEAGLTTARTYELQVAIDGRTATLSPGGAGGGESLSHGFEQDLNAGQVGLAVEGGSALFDDLRLSTATLSHVERFTDGRAGRLTAASGAWQVVDWGFENVSERARVNEPQLGMKAVFLDYDHDNDLDICVVNGLELGDPPDRDEFTFPRDFEGQVNTILRNNGNGTFDDRTDEAGLLIDFSRSRDVLYADFDGDSDTDIFVANADGPSLLFANQRLGRFKTGGRFRPILDGEARAAAAGDFNHDGHIDLALAIGGSVLLYTNGGHAEFEGRRLALPRELERSGAGEIEILDYNNDGWSDLLIVAADGAAIRLMAGAGPGLFRDLTARAGLEKVAGPVTGLAVGDIEGDGDTDIILKTREAGPRLLVNQGGNRRHWLAVRPVGKKVNSNGYGATVEIAGGGHYQKQVVHQGPVHFGLGDLEGVDTVRVTWPNGVVQNVVTPGVDTLLEIAEHVKVSASCGFLWADAGAGFGLINEILGVGALGAPIAPGVHHKPDHTELTMIEADRLASRNGFYELRLTEELRETMYLDQATLRVVDHPAGVEIVPNEMFRAPPFPEDRFFAVAAARPPRAALDERGRDVLELILRRDGRFPTFPLVPRYDGLAEPHSLTLDLGDLSGAEQITLFLDGWIYWPEASTVMAMAQDPRYGIDPLALQVRDAGGGWRTAIPSVGLPTSKGLIVPVDLTGRFPGNDYQVRLVTNLRVYLDRVFVSTGDDAGCCRVSELPVARADLHYRGFSALRRDRLGYERFDYDRTSLDGSWSPPAGMLTRYGDVTPLLHAPEDRYVILGPGDELTMHFDGRSLPELPGGWTRDFIFFADGWVKDGDLNTTYSETIEPLPFHGMSGYPYSDEEGYPDTPGHDAYRREYNTRPGVPTVGRLIRSDDPAERPE